MHLPDIWRNTCKQQAQERMLPGLFSFLSIFHNSLTAGAGPRPTMLIVGATNGRPRAADRRPYSYAAASSIFSI